MNIRIFYRCLRVLVSLTSARWSLASLGLQPIHAPLTPSGNIHNVPYDKGLWLHQGQSRLDTITSKHQPTFVTYSLPTFPRQGERGYIELHIALGQELPR
jgi:hypothetical protein